MTTEIQTVQIDGAAGEGGGQIIRTGVSLAALTGRSVEIINIRARRSKPGLQAQHLTAVRAAAALCNAELTGAELGSLTLRLTPGERARRETFTFDVAEARGGASAGATGLVAQTLLVPLALLSEDMVAVEIKGGTHVPMSPPADYIQHVYTPLLRQMGLSVTCKSTRAGFFPRGGGEIHLKVEGGALRAPVDFVERGKLTGLRLCIITSQLPEHVAARGQDALLKELKGYGVPIAVELRNLEGNGAGAAVVLVAECKSGLGGWTSLGERGKPMERVALEALRGFQNWYATGAGVDEHLADQLVLPCALTAQTSRWTTPEITEHLRTVLWVAEQFLPISYTLEQRADGTGLVTLHGVAAAKIAH